MEAAGHFYYCHVADLLRLGFYHVADGLPDVMIDSTL
jgi:hypothetical protein